jgi:DNA modification methylase
LSKFPTYKTFPISGLIPYARNSRTHSEDQITKIAASIKEFGFLNPVIVDGENGIVAGHGRVLAAKKLGMNEVPVIEASHLTEAQRRAYVIADNRLALDAGWDDEMLRVEFAELEGLGFDLDLTGFTPDEIAALQTEQLTEGLTDEDAVPEVPVDPVTKPGDVWLLGNHRVMCGDSTSIDAVQKLMAGDRTAFCFTSPPYNAGDSEKLSGNTHTDDNKYGLYQDNKTQNEYLELLNEFCSTWISVSDCLCVNIQQLAGNKIAFIEWLSSFKQNFVDMAIWDKGHSAPPMARNVMSSRFEYLVFLSASDKPSRAIPCADFRGTVQNVYTAPPQRNNEFSSIHAATFPVHLPEWAIETFTKKKSAVSDAFGGTGTTLIAAEKTGRTAYLMELDPKYCDVIVKRWQDFTGKQATLESTGQTFAEVSNVSQTA